MLFHIGQRVVCIWNEWETSNSQWQVRTPNKPYKGGVYVIRDILKDPALESGVVGLYFEEILNPISEFVWNNQAVKVEPAFSSACFRPVKDTRAFSSRPESDWDSFLA